MMSSISDDCHRVVFDIGSQVTKVGFGTEASPRSVFPSVVGRFVRTEFCDAFPSVSCGKEAILKRGQSNLVWPVREGMVQDWLEMETLWHHIFYKELQVPPEQAEVMHTVHPLVSRSDKEKMAEILFETFMVQGLYLAKTPVLALHASGRTSGIVWENGALCAHAVPVFEGYPLRHAIVKSPLHGEAITDILQKSLANIGYSFTTPSERDLLHQMKVDFCYVSEDYDAEASVASSAGDSASKYQYKLPDGQHIIIGEERFKTAEVLFHPEIHDFHCPNVVDVIVSSLKKCDIDTHMMFYNNVVIAGGSSMFSGFTKRLSRELLFKARSTTGAVVNVDSLVAIRQFAAWAGGSILSSLSSLKGFWMTRKEYEDDGVDTVNHKFF